MAIFSECTRVISDPLSAPQISAPTQSNFEGFFFKSKDTTSVDEIQRPVSSLSQASENGLEVSGKSPISSREAQLIPETRSREMPNLIDNISAERETGLGKMSVDGEMQKDEVEDVRSVASPRLESSSIASGSNLSSATDLFLAQLRSDQLQRLVDCSGALTSEQMQSVNQEDELLLRQSYSHMSLIMFDWLSRIYVNAGFHKNAFVKRNNQIMMCKCCPLHCIVAVSKAAKKLAGRKPKPPQ